MVGFAQTLKRSVWVASGSMVDGIRQFDRPVEHRWSWRGLSSGADMLAFGPSYMDYRKASTMNRDVDNIKRLDKVWMDLTPADPNDPLASDADFYVSAVEKGAGGVATITFKRLSADGD